MRRDAYFSLPRMDPSVAACAQADEIVPSVVSQLAPRVDVVDVEMAKREGRTLSQICEIFVAGGLEGYRKEGPRYLQRFLSRQKKEDLAE